MYIFVTIVLLVAYVGTQVLSQRSLKKSLPQALASDSGSALDEYADQRQRQGWDVERLGPDGQTGPVLASRPTYGFLVYFR